MIPAYIKQANDKYLIKIGHPKDELNQDIDNLNNLLDTKIKLFISNNLSAFGAASLFNDLIHNNNNNYITDRVIMYELYQMFNTFLVDLEIKIKEYNLPAVLDQRSKCQVTKGEIWLLSFIGNVIAYKLTYNVNTDNLISNYKNLLISNKSIKKRVDVLNKNEIENNSMNILWKEFNFHNDFYGCNETNFILGIDPYNKLNLGVLKKNLIKFQENHYDINLIVNNIVKYLKVVSIEKYNETNGNGNGIEIDKNYRLTPMVNNKKTDHTKFLKDYYDLSLSYLFRCVGVYLKFDEIICLVTMILYSDCKIDPELEKYFKVLLNTNYIYNILNEFNKTKVDILYIKYILILFHTNEEKSRNIFGEKYDQFINNNSNNTTGIKHFNKIPFIKNKDIENILLCVFFQNVIEKYKNNKGKLKKLSKSECDKNIKKIVSNTLFNTPFTNELKLHIINYICNNQSKILNENILENVNNISIKFKNIKGILPYFKLNESNNHNVQLYKIYDNLVFKNVLRNCNLCDEITYIDSESYHHLDCKNHHICNGCASKLYRTNIYNQGDYVNERNFVCSFCRHPEHNIIYQIPLNFYENIVNHRLCSFANCTKIVNSDIHRLCNVNNDNQRDEPIYCVNHTRIMTLMAMYSLSNNSELHIKLCPGCDVSVNKIEGCNHMKCNCGIHFCWVCDYSQDNSTIYNHPSYCRGNNSWEEGLNVMLKIMVDFYSQISDMTLNNNEIHHIYSDWLKDMLSNPKINAASYWDLTTWINTKLNNERNNIILDASNLTLNISHMCEWITLPNDTIIYNVVQNIIFYLNNLKRSYPILFDIPTETTILQYR